MSAGPSCSERTALRQAIQGVDADTLDLLAVLSRILATEEPVGRNAVQRVMADACLLRCFVDASSNDSEAAARLVLSYASWCALGLAPSDDERPLKAGDKLLVEVVHTADPVVAVVRDVRVLARLLDDFSFEKIICSHVARIERLLHTSEAARRHGISVVQDLSEMDTALVKRLLDPRVLLAQSRAARFLIGSFPVRWASLVFVDAPSAFHGLWRAVKKFFPAEFAQVRFVNRPDAERELEQLFGRAIL